MTWRRASLDAGSECDGIGVDIRLAVASPNAVLLLGDEPDPGAVDCLRHAVSWVTTDGAAWHRGRGLQVADAHVAKAWAVGLGWKAVIDDATGEHAIWRSSDGLSWTKGAVIDAVGPIVASGVDPSGTRLISIATGDEDQPIGALQASTDGRTWQRLPAPSADQSPVDTLVPPGPDHRFWIATATTGHEDIATSTMWISADLAGWTEVPFPLASARPIVPTTVGLLALGQDECGATGSPCVPPPRPPDYFLPLRSP
jgi:hypothetical protein